MDSNSINKVGAAKRKPARKKNNKRRKQEQKLFRIRVISIAVGAAIVVIGVISYVIWYNSFVNVKLSDYSTVTLSGYDTYGTAQLTVGGAPGYSAFFETVDATLNYSNNLSNGDELIITYTYDSDVAKECKLRVDDSDAHITVEGLAEATVVNRDMIFSGLNVSFEGTAPCVKVTVENTSDDNLIKDIEYTDITGKGGYDCGDEVIIEATIPSEYMYDHAYSFNVSDEDFRMTYTIPDGDRFFTDPSQVTDEILDELEKVGFGLISESDAKEYGLRIFQGEAKLHPVFVGNKTTFQWANPYVISAYFHAVTEDGKAMLETHANDVQIVYGVTLTQADGTSCLTEMVIQFVDLCERADGAIDTNTDSGRIVSVSYKDSNIKSLVTDDGYYITTKLTE